MTRKSHAVLGLTVLLVVVAAGIVGLGAAGAQSAGETPGEQTITVSATGSAGASPNQAVVRVSVTAAANDSATVRDDLAAGAETLRTAFDDLGVDYETARYTIEEQAEPRDPREPGGTPGASSPDYRGIHSFEITLDDTGRVGAVIDATADAGAEVNDVTFTLSDQRRTELRDQAIETAMSDARTQATTLATAGNLTVTNVATIEASQYHYSPVRYEDAAGGDAGNAATVVDGGEVSVTYDVRVTYNATT
jgi:uncharacterized protein YggE